MSKFLFTIIFLIILMFFIGIGKVGDTYMIVLKSKPTFSGTIFNYKMKSSNGFVGLSINRRVIYEISKYYPFIVLSVGPRGFIFMKEFK